MTLTVRAEKTLDIPADLYNGDGLAPLIVTGGRYGGDWRIYFTRDEQHLADIWVFSEGGAPVNDPNYPDDALAAAATWAREQAASQGLRLVFWDNHNHRYGPNERPYFCTAQAIFANDQFVPMPGVRYADEW